MLLQSNIGVFKDVIEFARGSSLRAKQHPLVVAKSG
jgi:hypothetical protein